MKISIATLTGELRGIDMIAALRSIWREAGHDVACGTDFAADADVCVLHQNRTRLNPAEIPAAPQGAAVINGRVLDISKRLYSTLALDRGSDWSGSVIVKSNLNHFGLPETRDGARSRTAAQRIRRKLFKNDWRRRRMLPHREYPILDHLDEVPSWVWKDPDLLVEKFMPERHGELFALRGYIFLGSQSYGYRLFATHPLVKTGTMVRYEYIDDAPPEIVSKREDLGFDFGKFDYVMDDGKAVLLDANRTPSFAGDPKSERLKRLAIGIEDFL